MVALVRATFDFCSALEFRFLDDAAEGFVPSRLSDIGKGTPDLVSEIMSIIFLSGDCDSNNLCSFFVKVVTVPLPPEPPPLTFF